VESASKPLSNDEIKKEKEKRDKPEGKLDKNGNILKFSRTPAWRGLRPGGDLESDWSAPCGISHYVLCLCTEE